MKSAQNPCAARKRDGTACRAAALPGARFCYFHSPAHAAARRQAQSLGGQGNRMTTLPADTPEVKVESSADVARLLSATINQVRRGELDPRIGNTVGYLANILLTATGQRELENRLAELEALLKHRPPAA